MNKLFIVDDNPLDRRGVSRLCDWPALGLEVAGVYANGLEALEAAERLQPDVVLTDVQMPVMDGIELGAALKERFPAVKLLFMSSHDDFVYARSALKLEAGDYVLKPIRKNELLAAVSKVTDKLAEERAQDRERGELLAQLRQSLPTHREQFMRELLFGTLADAEAEAIRRRMELLELGLPADGRYRVMLLSMTGVSAGEPGIPGYLRLTHHLQQQMAGAERSLPLHIRLVPVSERQLALVVCSPDGRQDELQALDLIVQAEEDTDKTEPLQLSIGISKAGGIAEMARLYAQAARAAEAKGYSDRQPRVLFWEEIAESGGDSGEPGLPPDAERLRQDIRELLVADADADPLQPLGAAGGAPDSRLGQREVQAYMLLLSNTLQQLYVEAGKPLAGLLNATLQAWSGIERMTTVSSVRDALRRLLGAARGELFGDQATYYDKVVRQIKTIVAKRYAEPLTIQDIADEVFLSLSHANNIFKSKTGNKIFDFLTETRMERAKQLLKDPESRIYQVAQQVGYANKSHFCLIFKKYTGFAPSEFKSRSE